MKVSEDLIDEVKQTFTEGEFNSRWELIQAYHKVGSLIKDVNRETSQVIYELAPRVGKSVRALWYAVKFVELYPSLNLLPEGKNVSMNQIITKYLSNSKQEMCEHAKEDIEVIKFRKCIGCGKHLGKI